MVNVNSFDNVDLLRTESDNRGFKNNFMGLYRLDGIRTPEIRVQISLCAQHNTASKSLWKRPSLCFLQSCVPNTRST